MVRACDPFQHPVDRKDSGDTGAALVDHHLPRQSIHHERALIRDIADRVGTRLARTVSRWVLHSCGRRLGRASIVARMGRTELVIFDCDGVLIDSEVISATMLIAALKGYGVEVDLEFVSRRFLGRSYPVVLKEVRDTFGIALPDHFEAGYRARLLAAFERHLTIMPGVRETIARLGLPSCVATSSSPERVNRSLQLVGLAEVFGPRVFTSSLVDRGKPAPDLFLFTAARMGVAPARCLVIEDSLNGVQAGLTAGMEVWRYIGGSHLRGLDMSVPDTARAHRQISDFATFFDGRPELLARSGVAR